MSNSLYTLLNEHVLTEGRKEDVMAKYPNVAKDIIEYLSQNDPSGNNKYLDFMVGEVAKGGNKDQILRVVTAFNTKLPMVNKQNLQDYAVEAKDAWGQYWDKFIKSPKDINSYPGLTHVDHFMNFLDTVTSKKKEKEQLNKETDRIYEDENYIVVAPKTHNASCQWGRHSAWCVATANTGHFNNYMKNGTLYFFISKKNVAPTRYWSDKDNGQPPYKTALLLHDDGRAQWWSKGDSNYTDGLDISNQYLSPFLNQTMVDRVLKHNKVVIEARKQREIDRVRASRGFYKRIIFPSDSNLKNDFQGFVRTKIFKPEQLVEIIRNDNWLALYDNSETGKEIRNQIGNNTVFSLIRELLTSTPNLLETLKDFHSQEFLTNYSPKFTDEENTEIASIVLKRLGKKPTASEVGGDVKMYVDKWTMTPEQWDQYNRTSSYFFIGDGKGDIENLVKGDRFNPKDHHALQMMMLRAKMNPGTVLYALVTDKGILDEFIGKGTSEIPDSVRETIMSKAKRLGG